MTVAASKSLAAPSKTAEQLVHCTAAQQAAGAAPMATPPSPPAAAAPAPAPAACTTAAKYLKFTIQQHYPVYLHASPPTFKQTMTLARNTASILFLNCGYVLSVLFAIHLGFIQLPEPQDCMKILCLTAIVHGVLVFLLQLSVPNVWLHLADFEHDVRRPKEANWVRVCCALFVVSLGVTTLILTSVWFLSLPWLAIGLYGSPEEYMLAALAYLLIVIAVNAYNLYACCVGFVKTAWLLELKLQLLSPANRLLYTFLKEQQPQVLAVAAMESQRRTEITIDESIV